MDFKAVPDPSARSFDFEEPVRRLQSEVSEVAATPGSQLNSEVWAGNPVVRSLEARLAIANDFQNSSDIEDFTLRLANRALPQIFDSAACSIFLVNEARDRLNLFASTGVENITGERITWYTEGQGTTGWVWAHREFLRIPLGASNPELHDAPAVSEDAIGAGAPKSREKLPEGILFQLLALPIMHHEQVVGVVRLAGHTSNNRFSMEDERLARELSEELGALLVKRQVADREKQYGHALIRLGEELQQETEENVALRLLLAAVTCGKGLAFNRAVVWLSDLGQSRLEPALVVGYFEAEEVHRIWDEVGELPLDKILSQARQGSRACPRSDVFAKAVAPLSEDARDVLSRCFFGALPSSACDSSNLAFETPGNAALMEVFEPDRFAVVPLQGEHQCLGVLFVDNYFDHKPVDDALITMLRKFAHLRGLALERIREARWRVECADTHYRLTAAIVEEPNSERRVSRVLEELHRRFGFERWLLYYHDPKTRLVSVLGSRGFDSSLHSFLNFDASLTTDAVAPYVVRNRVWHTHRMPNLTTNLRNSGAGDCS